VSHIEQTDLVVDYPVGGPAYEAAMIESANGSRPAMCGQVSPPATSVLSDSQTSLHGPDAGDESRLSKAEILLLREKEALAKLVEELASRRQEVARERRKAEQRFQLEEAQRQAAAARYRVEEEARRHAEEEERQLAELEALRKNILDESLERTRRAAQLHAEIERLCLDQEEERKLITAAETQRRTEEAARAEVRARAEKELQRLEEVRLCIAEERQKLDELGSRVAEEECRLALLEVMRETADDEAHERLTLEQRLRAEIDALAEAQRKHIDASRSQLNVLRSRERYQASSIS
jgi:hypothetical protein